MGVEAKPSKLMDGFVDNLKWFLNTSWENGS